MPAQNGKSILPVELLLLVSLRLLLDVDIELDTLDVETDEMLDDELLLLD